jgi:hypothetical protein
MSSLPPRSSPRPQGVWHHIARSTYVTVVTDWFLGFVGKAAHLILILTTLYTGAELLPGVVLPASLNTAVFVIQMLALDVGGMGLAKLAMQAKDRGNSEGARQAEQLSTWLIRLVIASLVTVAIEQASRALPVLASWSSTIAGIAVIIGAALTIARAICAVHYGRVMHLLHADEEEPSQRPCVEELVQQAVSDLATTLRAEQQQALAQLRQEIERYFLTNQNEARASGCEASLSNQSQAMQEPGQSQSRPHHAPAPEPLALEPVPGPKASKTAQARLQSAYDLLVVQGQRISGRTLAKTAHVNRTTATAWLAAVQGQGLEPVPEVLAQGQSEAMNEVQQTG